jgi:hypothetical protein
MAKPNLSVSVQPNVSGRATCLPLAASAADVAGHVKIVLRLDITNAEPNPVTIYRIRYSFPGTNNAAFEMVGENVYYGGILTNIAPGATVVFSNGRVDLDPDPNAENFVESPQLVPPPVPPQVTVGLYCNGFSEPFELTMDLVAHLSPVAGNAYLFPFQTIDLRPDEYYVGSGSHWANGGNAGPQIFAHDLGVEGLDPDANWTALLPGTNGTQNNHYRMHGKWVRAMADGVVQSVFDGLAENTTLGQFPNPPVVPGTGNNVWIKHGTEYVVYCHLQPGLPANIVAGATVTAGQPIGRVGNTGNSTAPHTHIEVRSGSPNGPLRPFPFRNTWLLKKDRLGLPNTLWVQCTGQGLSKDDVAIWPAITKPSVPSVMLSKTASLYSGPKTYFFAGTQYIRVTRDELGAGTVDAGFPKSISLWNWGDFGKHGIDAALYSGSKDYFFSGTQYIRVTRDDLGAGTVDFGYPKPISAWGWGEFGKNGIDAALFSGTKTFFFAGNQYIRVTRSETGAGTVDDGYPKSISLWGWGEFGKNGIDAALNSGSKCYFFAGSQYIRVTRNDDVGPGTVDPGYPKSISLWEWPIGFQNAWLTQV